MRREVVAPRPDWREKLERCGLIWHSSGAAPYWNESACYVFTRRDVAEIERATRELYSLFLEAGQHVIDRNLFGRFGVPDWCIPLIKEAWTAEPPALNYGRFDLGYDGRGPPKLFEFNCDTPTALLEASVAQWFWKQDLYPNHGQFNDIHDTLIAKWRDIAPHLAGPVVHFAHQPDRSGEDAITTAYMMDLARAAGLTPLRLTMGDIGWKAAGDGRGGGFYDLEAREIRTLYKLYPWEWLVREPFGRNIAGDESRTRWIEPIWKMIWSNKAILPILWDLHPRHPNLLWARTDGPAADSYAKKPLLAREGANVTLVKAGRTLAATDGPYTGPVIYQGLYDLPDFGGCRPVIGSWCVDGVPAGMGVREDGPITSNLARFTPHIVG